MKYGKEGKPTEGGSHVSAFGNSPREIRKRAMIAMSPPARASQKCWCCEGSGIVAGDECPNCHGNGETGRCASCGEDELEGGRCLNCGEDD